jgi:DNA-binding transcriptional MerR regulator
MAAPSSRGTLRQVARPVAAHIRDRELEKAPDAFRTISEVAEEIDVPQHVLRFWESRFAQIKPMKRGGGRRYYRPDDIDLLRGVRHLLYGEGYTIRGVQRILRDEGVAFVQNVWRAGAATPPPLAEEDRVDDFAEASEDTFQASQEASQRASDERMEPDLSSLTLSPPHPAARAPQSAERREPTFAAAASTAAPPPAAKLSPAAEAKLRAALDELVACRSLIDSALSQAAPAG